MTDHERSLHGVGGWLAFFILTLGLFTPLRIFFNIAVLLGDDETAAAYGPDWPLLVSLLVAID